MLAILQHIVRLPQFAELCLPDEIFGTDAFGQFLSLEVEVGDACTWHQHAVNCCAVNAPLSSQQRCTFDAKNNFQPVSQQSKETSWGGSDLRDIPVCVSME